MKNLILSFLISLGVVSNCYAKDVVCQFPKKCINPTVYASGIIKLKKANFKLEAYCKGYKKYEKTIRYYVKNLSNDRSPNIIIKNWDKNYIKCN